MNIKLDNTGEAIDNDEALSPAEQALASHNIPQQEAAETTEATPESNGEAEPGDNNPAVASVKQVMRDIAGIGGQFGTGKKALMNLALKVTEAAQHKIISYEKAEKAAAGEEREPTIGEKLYQSFRKGYAKKAVTEGGVILESNAGSDKVQVSKLNTFIKFGNKYGEEAVPAIELAIDVHAGLAADKENAKLLKLPSTYSALVAVAREHMKDDRAKEKVVMTEEELRAFFLGDEAKTRTGADFIDAAIKSIKQAQKGRDATDKNPDAYRAAINHPGLEAAVNELREVLKHIDPKKYEALLAAEQKDMEAANKLAADQAMAEIEQEDAASDAEEAAE